MKRMRRKQSEVSQRENNRQETKENKGEVKDEGGDVCDADWTPGGSVRTSYKVLMEGGGISRQGVGGANKVCLTPTCRSPCPSPSSEELRKSEFFF